MVWLLRNCFLLVCLTACRRNKTFHSGGKKWLLFLTWFIKLSQEYSVLKKIHAHKILHLKLICYINIFSMVSDENRVVELAALITSHFTFEFGL